MCINTWQQKLSLWQVLQEGRRWGRLLCDAREFLISETLQEGYSHRILMECEAWNCCHISDQNKRFFSTFFKSQRSTGKLWLQKDILSYSKYKKPHQISNLNDQISIQSPTKSSKKTIPFHTTDSFIFRDTLVSGPFSLCQTRAVSFK